MELKADLQNKHVGMDGKQGIGIDADIRKESYNAGSFAGHAAVCVWQ